MKINKNGFGISVLNILICCSVLPLSPSYAAQKESLVINSGSSAPLIISDNEGFYPQLTRMLFDRLGISVQVLHLPSSRSLQNANQGVDDGVIARVKGIDKKNTNLIMVPEKVIDLDFVAFSNDRNIKIESWKDLKDYNVAYVRGWKIFDKNVSVYKSLVKAKDSTQMFKLLRNGRADVVLHQNIPGRYLLNTLGYHPYQHVPPLTSRELYLYMHKKHASLVPQISSELRKMKDEGEYKKLFDLYIAHLIVEDEKAGAQN
ncbi:MAG: transporter substrate-binding domain-containing protein [Gammaproteobacteria bacterium]|nr:transporter substrate-binding domain-containing protein [Gammaproteobacteria bacterium]